MARPGRKPKAATTADDGSETISSYFRRILKENRAWLKGRSNDAIMARWEADHPDSKESPGRIRAILSNVKSTLRSKARKRGGRKAGQAAEDGGPNRAAPTPARAAGPDLETLEEMIDECLTMAKTLDRAALQAVIAHLRTARNQVVWKAGQ